MHKQGRRVILIYKAHMYNKASLDLERCTHKSDEKAANGYSLIYAKLTNTRTSTSRSETNMMTTQWRRQKSVQVSSQGQSYLLAAMEHPHGAQQRSQRR